MADDGSRGGERECEEAQDRYVGRCERDSVGDGRRGAAMEPRLGVGLAEGVGRAGSKGAVGECSALTSHARPVRRDGDLRAIHAETPMHRTVERTLT